MEPNKPDKVRRPKFENRNLTGFFNLLLKIDMRENPHLYPKLSKKK